MKSRLPKGMSQVRINGVNAVVLYQTEIVRLEDNRLTLKHGGWQGPHTKKCINLGLNNLGLHLSVFQRKFNWFIRLEDGRELPFQDGVSFEV